MRTLTKDSASVPDSRGGGGAQVFWLIGVGIGVSAMLGSFNTWLMLPADLEVAMSAAVWGAGSLNGTPWEQAAIGIGIIIPLMAGLLNLAPALRRRRA